MSVGGPVRFIHPPLFHKPPDSLVSPVKLYFNGLGGSHPMLFFTSITLGLFLMEISNATQTWFLGYWASQYDDRPASEVDVF